MMENENGRCKFFLSVGLLAILLAINFGAFISIKRMNTEVNAKVKTAQNQIAILPDNKKLQYSDDEQQIVTDIRNLIKDVSIFLSKYIWAIVVGIITSFSMLTVKKITKFIYKDCLYDEYSDWTNRAIIVCFLISMLFVLYDINSAAGKINDIREIANYIEKTYGIIDRIGSQWLK